MANPNSNPINMDLLKALVDAISTHQDNTDPPIFSERGQAILNLLKRPILDRPSVSYSNSLLENYQPNETFYLPQAIRAHLRHLGTPNGIFTEPGSHCRQILDRFLVDIIWSSAQLSGSSYSLMELERLINLNLPADEKNPADTQLLLNQKWAVEYLIEHIKEFGFHLTTVQNYHALMDDNLSQDSSTNGLLRTQSINMNNSSYLAHVSGTVLGKTFKLLLSKAQSIKDPFEQAFFLLVHIPYLYPFNRHNRKISWILANATFITHNLCPIVFLESAQQLYHVGTVSVAELNEIDLLRDIFISEYENSCRRYLTFRKATGNTDTFRMRYREQLLRAVQHTLKSTESNIMEVIRKWSSSHITVEDRQQFEATLLNELEQLHEGNIARYRIRPNELNLWQNEIKKGVKYFPRKSLRT